MSPLLSSTGLPATATPGPCKHVEASPSLFLLLEEPGNGAAVEVMRAETAQAAEGQRLYIALHGAAHAGKGVVFAFHFLAQAVMEGIATTTTPQLNRNAQKECFGLCQEVLQSASVAAAKEQWQQVLEVLTPHRAVTLVMTDVSLLVSSAEETEAQAVRDLTALFPTFTSPNLAAVITLCVNTAPLLAASAEGDVYGNAKPSATTPVGDAVLQALLQRQTPPSYLAMRRMSKEETRNAIRHGLRRYGKELGEDNVGNQLRVSALFGGSTVNSYGW